LARKAPSRFCPLGKNRALEVSARPSRSGKCSCRCGLAADRHGLRRSSTIHESATGQPAAHARRRSFRGMKQEHEANAWRLHARVRANAWLLGRPLGRLLSSWKIPDLENASCPAFGPPRSHSMRRRGGSRARVGAPASQRKRAMRVRSKPSLDVCDADLIACTLRAPSNGWCDELGFERHETWHGARTLRQAIARQRLQVRELDVGTPDQDFW
jgi:hypothetical protein